MKVVLSFSGGKDSSLALYRLQQLGMEVMSLVTTVWNDETVAHEEKLDRLEEQAKRIGIPIYFIRTSFDTYTDDFISTVKMLKENFHIDGIAYGDIYLDGHREWGENVAEKAGLKACYPIWTEKEKSMALLQEFVDLGFKAKVIKVDETKLPKSWIGRIIDESFIKDVTTLNICPLGESGEYHTYVFEGPIFKEKPYK